MRGAASSIRYVLDNPLAFLKGIGATTNMEATLLASTVFGRDEEDNTMELRQADVDEVVLCLSGQTSGESFLAMFPLNPN